MTRRAAIYCRISQDRDSKAEGVKRQEKDCCDLVRDLGWEVVDVYVDNDVSATSGRRRPSFDRMKADITSGRVDAVVAYHPDRLVRRPVELEAFIELVEKHGVEVNTSKAGNYDLSTASGKMVARMIGAAARHETDRMSERIKRTKEQKASDGLWKGGSPPFGYRPVKGKSGYLEVEDTEAEILRELVDKFLAGASLRSLAVDLQKRGVERVRIHRSGPLKGQRDTDWKTGDIRRMIERPVAAGLVYHHGEFVAKGVWEPIIPEDKWRAVRSILGDPARKMPRGRKQRYLLSGIATCGGPLADDTTCTHTIMANAGDFYRCGSGREGGIRPEGHHVYRKRSDLDAYARELAIARLARKDAASLLVREESRTEDDPAALSAEIDNLRKRLNDAAETFASGDITRAQLTTISSKLKATLEDLEGRLAVAVNTKPKVLVPELADADETGDAYDLEVATARAEKVWDALTIDRQREILRHLVRITVLPSQRRGRNPFMTSDVRVDWLT